MKGLKDKKLSDVLSKRNIVVCLILLIVMLAITTVVKLREAAKDKEDNKEKSIVYTESSKVDYNVYLKENEFFKEPYLGKGKQYIASIINYVQADFKYELKSSEPGMAHKYTYKIVAETNVEHEKNKNSIYKLTEELVPEKSSTFNSSKKLSINEKIQIDYHKYNNIIKKFIEVYGLSEIESTVTVKLYVKVDEITKSSSPVTTLTIPLTTKTVAIDLQSHSVNAREISVYKEIANKNNLYIGILTGILTLMIIIELVMFTQNTKDAEAIYKNKVKKLLMNYNSYIQKVNNDVNFENYQKLEVEAFDDLLQIRDTINEPILMIEGKKETSFLIPSKGNVLYTYKLSLADCQKELKEKEEKKNAKKKTK